MIYSISNKYVDVVDAFLKEKEIPYESEQFIDDMVIRGGAEILLEQYLIDKGMECDNEEQVIEHILEYYRDNCDYVCECENEVIMDGILYAMDNIAECSVTIDVSHLFNE